MICLYCPYCKLPRYSLDDGNSAICLFDNNKIIDVFFTLGEVPSWCPLNNQSKEIFKK